MACKEGANVMKYIKDITDEQIIRILDLTTHPPEKTEAIWSRNSNQREGMDTFVGTDEELVSKIRHILKDTPCIHTRWPLTLSGNCSGCRAKIGTALG